MNSSTSSDALIDDKFIDLRVLDVAKLTTNSFVAIIFASVSFLPEGFTDDPATNITCGGLSAIALKYEYGARFATPFLSRDDIHPIGLGNINDL
tara:strand:- start:214 stop:495 length:282 start_codon:yes stop_codon:yes gene_type:complete